MQPKTSRADFEALVRRAGLPLTDAQIADIHGGAWAYMEVMLERVRGNPVDERRVARTRASSRAP